MFVVSGKDCVKVATKLGFVISRQKGSHLILHKDNVLLVIPMHKVLKPGTLNQILKILQITRDEFKELL